MLFVILPGPTGLTSAYSLPLGWGWPPPLGRKAPLQATGVPSRPRDSMFVKQERSRPHFTDRLGDE